jgi:predicted amidohydrolase
MAEKDEGTVVRLIRYLALGVPTLSRVLAVAFVIAALALAFFQFGDYDPGARADLAMLFAVLALVALGAGYVVPWLVRTLMPPRR